MCAKHGFRDEIGAKFALAKIQRRDNPKRPKQECRAYLCPKCKKWHLTSMPLAGPTAASSAG